MEMENFLKESYPYSIYKELNEQVVSATDNKYCNEFKKVNNDYQDKSIELCKKVTKLLEFVYEKDKSKDFKDYCTHYKYWVYQEVKNLFNENTSDSVIEDVIKKFNKLQIDHFTKHEKRDCSYRFDYNTFKGLHYKIEEKSLHDYFRNFNTIKSSETCNNCNNGKYKKYLQSIDKIYKNLKEDCCITRDWDCSNYFLTCNNKFDPSVLLSTLGTNDKEECNGLNSITANIDEEILNSKLSDPGILDSFTHVICFNMESGQLKSVGAEKQLHCSLVSASGKSHRTLTTSESVGHQVTNTKSPSSEVDSIHEKSEAEEVKSETIENGGDSSDAQVNGKVISNRVSLAKYKWSLNPDGNLDCRTKSKSKHDIQLCNFMEELVEGKFATQIEGTGRYKVKVGTKWTEADLKQARERVRKRRSANESNILNNIFVRISTGVTLFTPFGSRLRRHRKRKQRYRFDFTDLSTRRRPRRFLKRTYRHSDRRRFNVVNIEDELHSSNDLQNIN
ncbi:hypothetical protein MKS88_004731 [Plasmodium brasilianum]|uniref:Uncharacterized protein n=1 Tax=Plasmodium brasilianum TaxID=5824 RepID=A0ACB9Y2S1_PLABR|nr:hypothetical protein MKS88_004731 [Plasmodium brasilianum]